MTGDVLHAGGMYGHLWEQAHPDEATWPPAALSCCIGAAVYGPGRCTCWEPVFECEQLAAADGPIVAAPAKCADCAYRPGSAERADEYTAEILLLDLPQRGEQFWCHQGMRRPVAYVHPQLGTMPGDSADWQPLIAAGTPRKADGTPALLCAGWSALRAKVKKEAVT